MLFQQLSIVLCISLYWIDTGECQQSKESYVLILPSKMRPGRSYDMSLSILSTNTPVEVYTKVYYYEPVRMQTRPPPEPLPPLEQPGPRAPVGPPAPLLPQAPTPAPAPAPVPATATPEILIAENTVTITQEGIISIQIPADALRSSYTVHVSGSGSGISFSNKTDVTIDKKAASIFIQTDKGTYKPGKIVKMRAFAVFPNLLSYKGEFNVTIEDPNKSIIKQWKNEKPENGVFDDQLQLSEQPVLGTWKIIVQTTLNAGESRYVTFEIAEYVLPKFEVSVDSPSFLLAESLTLPVTVHAKYTYGQNVKGNALISLQIQTYSDWQREYYQYKTINRTIQMANGVADTSFNRQDLLYLSGNQKCTSPMCYASEPCVADYAQIQSKLMYKTLFIHAEVTEELTGNVLSNNNTVSVEPFPVQMKFLEFTPNTFKPGLPWNGMIQLTRIDDSPLLESDYIDHYGQPHKIQITFECSNQTHYRHFVLEKNYTIPRSGLVEIDMMPNTSTTNCFINARYKYATTGKRLDKFLSSEGHSLILTAEGLTGAVQVSLEFSAEETRPGNNVTLTVNAHSGSYVGILAVDKSVQLMGKGNDITQDDVLSELRGYDSVSGYRYWYWPYYSWGKDTYEVIKNAGLIVLTDAQIFKEYVHIRGQPGIAESAPQGPRGIAGAPAGPVGQAGEAGRRADEAVDMETEMEDANMNTASSAGGLQEPQRVRTEFPETWIWTNEVVGSDGSLTFDAQAPDTITSWVASAFALSDSVGMGVTSDFTNLKVMKPFFLSLNLPYSVIRGEEIALQITVFNYMNYDLKVDVTLEASEDFEVHHPNAIQPTINRDVSKKVMIAAGDGELVSFWIVPKKIGQTMLSVKARSALAADHVQRSLLTEPEGEHHEFSRNVLINNNGDESTYSESMSVEFPQNTVDGSQRAVFTVIGDIMGPSVSGLDRLLRMPYGCGEQNMIKFAPNIYIMQYLQATNQLTDPIKNKALNYLESGYQRQLSYKRTEGSFSAFGNSDKAGSTWLTAFVIRCFQQAKPYILIDQSVIDRAILWIVQHQDRSGTFKEPGRVIHSSLQGGSSKGIGLTAYLTMALLENVEDIMDSRTKYAAQNSIDLGLRYLDNQLINITSDPYALSLVAYTLTMANHQAAQAARSALAALATVEGNKMYWKKDEPEPVGPVPYWYRYRRAPSYNIEMTAYGLLTYTAQNMVTEAVQVASWLATQRNGYGGYSSTQDTVIALQALSGIESMLGPKDGQNMNVRVVVDGMEHMFESITPSNKMVLQSYEVSSPVSQIDVKATGIGMAVFQMTIHYHQTETENMSGIEISVTSNTERNGRIETKACGTWTNDEESGMVVFEINQLTAYEPLTDSIISSNADVGVRRFEINGKTLTLYLDQLPKNEEVCITVTSVNVSPITNIQPAVVLIYPYYNPENQKSAFYIPEALNQGSMCEVCPQCCISSTVAPPTKDNCATQPCINGGRCIDDMNDYFCKCTAAYTGKNCQVKVNSASSNIVASSVIDNSAQGLTTISIMCVISFVLFIYFM